MVSFHPRRLLGDIVGTVAHPLVILLTVLVLRLLHYVFIDRQVRRGVRSGDILLLSSSPSPRLLLFVAQWSAVLAPLETQLRCLPATWRSPSAGLRKVWATLLWSGWGCAGAEALGSTTETPAAPRRRFCGDQAYHVPVHQAVLDGTAHGVEHGWSSREPFRL